MSLILVNVVAGCETSDCQRERRRESVWYFTGGKSPNEEKSRGKRSAQISPTHQRGRGERECDTEKRCRQRNRRRREKEDERERRRKKEEETQRTEMVDAPAISLDVSNPLWFVQNGRSNQTQLDQMHWWDHFTLITTLHHRSASCESFFPVVSNACWEITQDSQDSTNRNTKRETSFQNHLRVFSYLL